MDTNHLWANENWILGMNFQSAEQWGYRKEQKFKKCDGLDTDVVWFLKVIGWEHYSEKSNIKDPADTLYNPASWRSPCILPCTDQASGFWTANTYTDPEDDYMQRDNVITLYLIWLSELIWEAGKQQLLKKNLYSKPIKTSGPCSKANVWTQMSMTCIGYNSISFAWDKEFERTAES